MSSLVCRTVVSRQGGAGRAAVTSRWSDVGTRMWTLSTGRGGQHRREGQRCIQLSDAGVRTR